MTVRDSINIESIEKALNSLGELFKEIIQKNEALTEEVEKLKTIEKERAEDEIKKIKANIEYITLGNEANRALATIIPPPSTYQFQTTNVALPKLSPLDIMIEQQRRNLYG